MSYAVRIVTAMCDDFEQGQLVPVWDEPPDDDQLIRTENDFELHAIADEARDWRRRGWTDDEIRDWIADTWPAYADVELPGPRTWLTRGEANLFVELGDAEWVEFELPTTV